VAGPSPDNRRQPEALQRRRFEGKVAVVSGAGSGIGRQVARLLLQEGARVAFFGPTREKLEAARAEGPDASIAVAGRHEAPGDVQRVIAATVDAFGRLDLLVNNAGAYLEASTADTRLDDWRRILDVNLTGPFLLAREALPHLRRSGKGVIVNVASTLGLRPIPGSAAYSAAKAGLIQLTRSLALEEAPRGVRANAVCPGVVDTPIHRQRVGDDDASVRAFLDSAGKLHPLGRVGAPEDVAALILFLASEESSWTTGAVVTVDGGISLA
jgi:meso-butanediol dehydrogenase/(S,S)-butanediol dehydrogenase/diacetyl reductase